MDSTIFFRNFTKGFYSEPDSMNRESYASEDYSIAEPLPY
ncbi:hypothetical protein L21SP2_1243 [Salinispira pacifica]|uniref:Uncharacterized protein n=1 Tax=Salinispira pacifica TaxID=1307761 RepID=V5WGG8_9SPIO|nr:hypothetical protein L21SP2_1243 [Salinispira pacifica]